MQLQNTDWSTELCSRIISDANQKNSYEDRMAITGDVLNKKSESGRTVNKQTI